MNKDTPNAFAVIPAYILFDSTISSSARLVYGMISSLCRMRGYCFASNSYIGEAMGVSGKTASRWVSELESAGHVKVEDGDGKNRKIFLTILQQNMPDDNLDKNVQVDPTGTKMSRYPRQKCPGNLDKNVQQKNIRNKIREEGGESGDSNPAPRKTARFAPPSEQEVEAYLVDEKKCQPNHAKSIAEDIISFYGSKNWMVGKNKMSNWKLAASRWLKKEVEAGKAKLVSKEKPLNPAQPRINSFKM